MQSKRDQVQAHTFTMSRLTAGMLLADPDAPDSPLGRTTRGILVGVLIAVLVSAGAVVWGLVSPGGKTSWKTDGSLVMNKDTSARYLYLNGRLRPVRNVASARLIAGSQLTVASVGSASLQGTPVGLPVGIPGAPDSVPGAADLDEGSWLVCSTVRPARQDGPAAAPVTSVVVGAPEASDPTGSGEGILVAGPDKVSYLVWQGSRLRLDKASGAAVSLGYGSVTPRPVSAAFLDALVSGPTLAAPAVPGRGDDGPGLDGRASRVGQLFRVRVPGSAAQYYLLRKEGLVPVTDTGAALLLGDPETREKAYGGAAAAAADLGADALKQHLAAGSEGRSPESTGLPASPPRALDVPADSSACAGVTPDKDGTRVTTELVPTALLGPVSQVAPDEVAQACLRVDAVVVRPGHAALVRALGADGAAVGDTTYLVGDTGAKYRVPTAAALGALGYAKGQVAPFPSQLLAMLPSGPDLDPAAAAGTAPPRTTRPACGADSGGDAAGGVPQSLGAASLGASAALGGGGGTAALNGAKAH